MNPKDTLPADTDFVDEIEIAKANDLYKEYIGRSNIEKAGEEAFVTRSLMNDKSKTWIVNELSEKYEDEDYSFHRQDIEKFILRHDEIVQYLEDETMATARRHLQAQADVEEELASLVLFTRKVVQELHQKGDYSNLNSAIRALNKTISNYSDITGITNEEESPDNVITIYSDKYDKLKEEANKADFSREIDEEIVDPLEDEEE